MRYCPLALLFSLLADPLAAQVRVSGEGDAEPVALIALQLMGGAGIDTATVIGSAGLFRFSANRHPNPLPLSLSSV